MDLCRRALPCDFSSLSRKKERVREGGEKHLRARGVEARKLRLEATAGKRYALVAGGFSQLGMAQSGGAVGPLQGEPGLEGCNEALPVDGTVESGSRKSTCKWHLAPSLDDAPAVANRE